MIKRLENGKKNRVIVKEFYDFLVQIERVYIINNINDIILQSKTDQQAEQMKKFSISII